MLPVRESKMHAEWWRYDGGDVLKNTHGQARAPVLQNDIDFYRSAALSFMLLGCKSQTIFQLLQGSSHNLPIAPLIGCTWLSMDTHTRARTYTHTWRELGIYGNTRHKALRSFYDLPIIIMPFWWSGSIALGAPLSVCPFDCCPHLCPTSTSSSMSPSLLSTPYDSFAPLSLYKMATSWIHNASVCRRAHGKRFGKPRQTVEGNCWSPRLSRSSGYALGTAALMALLPLAH